MQANQAVSAALRPRLQLLGTFRLWQSDREIVLPGRKARAILAFLVLAPSSSATREQLAYLLWTDRGPDQARASLRQSLKELRELPCLDGAVTMTRGMVTLDPASVAADLHEIRHAAAARDLSALAALLEQVRGDLLENFLDVSPGFDEWLEAERPRQHDLVLGSALEAIEADGLADMKNTRSILRSLDRLDPVNEAVVRLGMRFDHAIGDGASLHRRYRQLCDRLESEFDALPSEETRALFHSLAANRDEALQAPPDIRPVSSAPARPRGGDLVPLVIVAPLQTTGADGRLAPLAEFCADDIRASLSRVRGIHVLAVDERDLDAVLQQSDEALGLYLLSGNLRQIGADVRVNIQLANAASRIIVWSESLRFDKAGEEMLDDVVGKASGAVLPAIDRDLAERLRQAAGELDDERAAYTRARLLIRSTGAVHEGVGLLERIIAANPRHLGAHLLLFRMYNTDLFQQLAGHDVARFRETAERHLRAAAAIEPGHIDVRMGRAWCHLRKGEIGAAWRELDALLANLPHDADLTNRCAMGFCLLGGFDEAERLMQRAFFLNPFPPSDYHADYAVILALQGRHEAAEEHFEVSGETGLYSSAVRIANAAKLDGEGSGIAATLARFADDFRSAWQPQTEPGLADVLEWVEQAIPLNPPEHMDWLRQGLGQMLEPCWPAAPDSGS